MSCLKWGIRSGTTGFECTLMKREKRNCGGRTCEKQFGGGWLDLRPRKCALALCFAHERCAQLVRIRVHELQRVDQ